MPLNMCKILYDFQTKFNQKPDQRSAHLELAQCLFK